MVYAAISISCVACRKVRTRCEHVIKLTSALCPTVHEPTARSLSIMRQGKVEGWHTPEALSLFLDAIKECYEAVVIYAFLQLMFAYVGVVPGKEVCACWC